MMNKKQLEERFFELGNRLADDLNPNGYWDGRLSSSALAVAVALAALHFDSKEAHRVQIDRGLQWLKENINPDGSFGDTPESPGNVSTSLLVYAAVNLYSGSYQWVMEFQQKIGGYLSEQGVDVRSSQVSKSVLAHYKNDYTFSVPILAMCGLCGVPGNDAFEDIPQLPFELSLMPRKFYRLLNLSVVSYAIPALVAVGIVIFRKKSSGYAWRSIRRISIPKAMNILHRMLPESGGYLEAVPLTAFVVLSLINSDFQDSEVVSKGVLFLKNTQREDGSWPIDVDLSTWVTSLSVKAFRSKLNLFFQPYILDKIAVHLKSIQNKEIHPFNGTGPGGWGWTNFPGSVPDGDDTPGTILALLKLQPAEKVKQEILDAVSWLAGLQNNDGGFPTFSRGWGKLPFDQSCADLTGHNLLAYSAVMEVYRNELSENNRKTISSGFNKAMNYLMRHQREDGSWLPLWFGNQQTKDHTNPVYGTARVVAYLKDATGHQWMSMKQKELLQQMINKGIEYLISVQNEDGSWGGGHEIPGTVEETALAVSALASEIYRERCQSGLEWLDRTYKRHGLAAAPIGLYFASLWYDEKLYPHTAYLEAVARMLEIVEN